MELIEQYFSRLKPEQIDQFSALWELYHEWNTKINVISRKDIDNLYLHHVLHSLAIDKYQHFKSGTKVMDLGTGGGFPGIPLAILLPEVKFDLIDGTKKKITVCNEVITALGLENVKAFQKRAEEHKGKYDFVVTRAVATIDKLVMWSRRLLSHDHKNSQPNGLIALKGGNIREEMKLLHRSEYTEVVPIQDYFQEEFFAEKYVVYVQG